MIRQYLEGEVALAAAFDKDYIAQLDGIGMPGRSVMGMAPQQGARKSRSLGQSLEFADYRDYAPGDDPRRIDWKGFGRTQRLFTKLFNEERQASLLVLVDTSASMDFGTPNKLRFAKLLAASLAYLALKNADSVRIASLGGGPSEEVEATSRLGFGRVVGLLDALVPSGVAQMRLPRAAPGACFVLSDFLHDPKDVGHDAMVKQLAQAKQDAVLLHILSPEEAEPTLDGYYRLKDAETGAQQEILITRDVLKSYNQALDDLQVSIRSACQKTKAVYGTVQTDDNILELVAGRIR